ncbi:hypothetical protein RRF57_009499 [Xylaria bambusicola]|uniref:Uncharacterized protein n=1 Tax=Xylaria bambusicola TaxID=326684 RepID=A0AAN7ZC00_9PEZI
MAFERNLAFLDKRLADASIGAAQFLMGNVGVGLRQEQSPDNEYGRGPGGEPVEWSPAIGRCVHEGASKGGSKKVTQSVALL